MKPILTILVGVPFASLLGMSASASAQGYLPPASVRAEAARKTPEALAARYAAWKLQAATGVPSPKTMAELELLLADAAEVMAAATDPAEKAALRGLLVEAMGSLQAARTGRPLVQPMDAPAVSNYADADVLEKAVANAVRSSDLSFIKNLGQRAVPALTKLALETTGLPAPKGQAEPGVVLGTVDLPAAMDVATTLVTTGSPLVKEHTVRWAHPLLRKGELFEPVGETDWRLLRPAWSAIILAAAEASPVWGRGLQETIATLVKYGCLPEELWDAVARQLTVHYKPIVVAASIRPLYRRLLTSKDAQTRSWSAEYLALAGDYDSMLAAANDPTERVRRVVAWSIAGGPCRKWMDANRSGFQEVFHWPAMDERRFDALLALWGDAEQAVSQQAIRAMERRLEETKQSALTSEQLQKLLAASPTLPTMNVVLTSTRYVAPEEQPALLKSLAAAAVTLSPRFPSSAEFSRELAGLRGFENPRDEIFWPLFRTLVSTPGSGGSSAAYSGLGVLLQSGEITVDPLLVWLEEEGTEADWSCYIGETDPRPKPWVAALSTEQWIRYVRGYDKKFPAALKSDLNAMERASLIDRTEIHEVLLADESLSVDVRRWCLVQLTSRRGYRVPERLLPAAVQVVSHSADASAGSWLLKRCDNPDAVVREWLADPNVQPKFFINLNYEVPNEAMAQALLKRVPPATWPASGSPSIAYHLMVYAVRSSTEAPHPLLAPEVPKGEYAMWAIADEIAQNRRDFLQPVLSQILATADLDDDAWKQAVESMAGYFNDEAAMALLETAKRTKAERHRKLIMEALRQLDDWRSIAAKWEKSGQAEAKRTAAIEKLVALLEDEAQGTESKAGALRGLGILGAAEELPRIVEGLSSSEPAIQEAARAALAKLEAAAEK